MKKMNALGVVSYEENSRFSAAGAHYVKQHDLQNYMDADILTMASLQSFQKEEHLIRTGTTSDYLYFLVEGSMMVYSYPSDTQNICIDFVTIATPLGKRHHYGGFCLKAVSRLLLIVFVFRFP